MVAAVEAAAIVGIYGRKIPVGEVFDSITTGRNAEVISRMWSLTLLVDREVGGVFADNGEEIFLKDFAVGYETSIRYSTTYIGGSVNVGTVHTHPFYVGYGKTKPSRTDVKNLLSRTYPGGIECVVGGRERPYLKILFLTEDVMESDLFLEYMDGGRFVDEVWHDFTDEDFERLVAMLTQREAELGVVGIPMHYYCDACMRRHRVHSGIGRWHIERGLDELLRSSR